MYYTEEIQLNEALTLLELCGLSAPEGVDYTVGVFREDGQLVATGSLKGDMIQGMAVDPSFQGEDLMAKVLTHLIGQAKDAQTLYLFTKPEKAMQFTGLGFRLIAKARPYAALLEWGRKGVSQYQQMLKEIRDESLAAAPATVESIGALVMNCNPFTLGHRYLIEEAARQCDHVFVLVVEEDLSRFPFNHRLQLVKDGTADLSNVTVISGGRYAVSTLTFPSYFTKEEKVADAHAAIDAELFASVIAPSLGVSKRFVGTEPLSKVTNIYNETLKTRLPKHGIEVIEIPRKEVGGQPISASRVRECIDLGGIAAWEEIKTLIPQATYDYLDQNHHKVTLMELLDAREQRVMKQQALLNAYDEILISMTMNIPGPIKDKPKYRLALEWAMNRMVESLENRGMITKEINHKVTGSEGYIVVDKVEYQLEEMKKKAIAIEEADELGRLFDIDVLSKAGTVSRRELGFGARKCLLCEEDAKVCARSQRHNMGDLLKKIEEILDGWES